MLLRGAVRLVLIMPLDKNDEEGEDDTMNEDVDFSFTRSHWYTGDSMTLPHCTCKDDCIGVATFLFMLSNAPRLRSFNNNVTVDPVAICSAVCPLLLVS